MRTPVKSALVCLLFVCVSGAANEPERPTELPPLLRPPAENVLNQEQPASPSPRGGPVSEYDHNHLYLPTHVPRPAPPETCRPLGRWWVNPSLELAWLPSRPGHGTVRLRVPDGNGGTIPGLVLPVGSGTDDVFQGGFGLAVGRFFGEAHIHAVEGSFYTVGADQTFVGYAPGMLVVFPQGSARSVPQVFVFPPPMNANILGAFPATASSTFTGADVNYRCNLFCTQDARLDVLAGYRFAYVGEELYLGDIPDPSFGGYKQNRASVANYFNGGQVGAAGEVRFHKWYAGGAAKIAFGVVNSETTATGMFVGAEGITAGGFQQLNSPADTTQTRFAVLPTVNLAVGRQIREHARVYVGYSFQYLNRTTRLADVLDPGTAGSPVTDFWVQAMNFGLELRY